LSEQLLPMEANNRLEFHSNIQWAPAYQRNNKANGQKNLRCFPNHCQGLGHQRGFCGHSIVINFFHMPHTLKGSLYSFGHFSIDDSELDSPAAAVAKGVSRDRYKVGDTIELAHVQSKLRQADEPLLEYIEGLELQDRRLDADGTVRVNFEFNRNLKGWHYGFLGSKLTRNVHHTFRAYVMEHVPATPKRGEHYRVLASVTSPKWKLYCRRRNRAGILGVPEQAPAASKPSPSHQMVNRYGDRMILGHDCFQRNPFELPPSSAASISRTTSAKGHHPVRRLKKRRDTTPETSSNRVPEFDAQIQPRQRSSSHNISLPRRFTSCPAESVDHFDLGKPNTNNGYTFPRNNGPYDGFTQFEQPPQFYDASDQYIKSEQQMYEVKRYIRRLQSQERLNLTGRSMTSNKRTSTDENEEAVEQKERDFNTHAPQASNAWVSCFDTLSRNQSIPRLFQLGHKTPEHESKLLSILQLVDIRFKNNNENHALGLKDHSQLAIFVSLVNVLLENWDLLTQNANNKKKTNPEDEEATSKKLDEFSFVKFLVRQNTFGEKMSKYAKEKSSEQRKADPYGTISFIMQLLNEYLPRFITSHSSPASPRKGVNPRKIFSCLSSLSLKDGLEAEEKGSPSKTKHRAIEVELEKFTQELEQFANHEGTDDITLKAAKSWKAAHTPLRNIINQKDSSANLLAKKLSENSLINSSFMHKSKKSSFFSLGNLGSCLNLGEHGSNENDFKTTESSMRDLDDFLKKECGVVDEVEEVPI